MGDRNILNEEYSVRTTYVGEEYIQEMQYGEYLVRALPSNAVDDFNRYVVRISSYSAFDRCKSPSFVEQKDGYIYVKFTHLHERPIFDVKNKSLLNSTDTEAIIRWIIDFAKCIELQICPPFPVYSVEDIYTYAGEFFFLPPLVFDSSFARKVVDSKYVFAAPEFLETGTYDTRSTMYVLGRLIEFFDRDGKYVGLTSKMTQSIPELRYFLFGSENDEKSIAVIENIVNRIESFLDDTSDKFNIIQLKTNRYDHYRSFLMEIMSEISRKSNIILAGSMFMNVICEILYRYGNQMDSASYYELSTCLYSVCRFDNIIPHVIQALEKLESVTIAIDDLENCDTFTRKFLSYIRGDEVKSKITVITNNSSTSNLTIDIEKEFFSDEDNWTDVERSVDANIFEDRKLQLLSILGQDFSIVEVEHLEKIIGEDFEETLGKAIKLNIISKRQSLYYFKAEMWNLLYERLPKDYRTNLHFELAKLMEHGRSSYIFSFLRSARQYEYAGKRLTAAVLYMKSIKWNLEHYVLSPTRIVDMFKEIYELLKSENRLDSYSFNMLRLKFQYQTGQEALSSIPILDSEVTNLISVFKPFVEQKYEECIEKASKVKPKTEFEKYEIEFLQNYAYYSLNDMVLDEELLEGIVKKLGETNIVSAQLKSEIFWLIGNSIIYSDPKRSSIFLAKADELAKRFNIMYLLIKINNSYGILYDGQSLSIVYFRKALQIAIEIGYNRRTISSRYNFLRSLLYFGRLPQLREELKRVQRIVSMSSESNNTERALLLNITGFYYIYEQKYDKGLSCLTEAYNIEKELGLQHSSLRTLVLLELICGHFENAKRLVLENQDDAAIGIRGFDYLQKLILAETDDEFVNAWKGYRDSKINLLREEILYIFSERLAKVDPEGFLREVHRWENVYTVEQARLSLFYVLLAKYRYYDFIGNDLRKNLTDWELCRLGRVMDIDHPFLSNKSCKQFKNNILVSFLEVFKFIDPNISVDDFVRLFASLLFDAFSVDEVYVNVKDEKLGIDYTFSTAKSLPDGTFFSLSPLKIKLTDKIDEDCESTIYMSSHTFFSEDENETEQVINILEETFIGQIKAIISREVANRDSLTGLYSRWYIDRLIDELLKEFSAGGTTFSVFMTDIDDFKKVNDTYGHLKGDEVLKEIARIIKEFVDEKGTVGRYGGEEFIGIVMLDKDQTYNLCEQMRTTLELEMEKKFGFKVTLSIGIASTPEKLTETELIGLSDQRLYRAKELGKNRTIGD